MKRLLIIGGGAAGMAAAISAAKADCRLQITILERMPRVGKKILATGNGRCNLGNKEIAPAHYHSDSNAQMALMIAQMPAKRTTEFFSQLGLICDTEDMGRIYPRCRQASMVVDVLLLALKRLHIQTECDTEVIALKKTNNGYTVNTATEKKFHADAVILCTGGKAAPKQGSNGSGYILAGSLGHKHTALRPCLVALKSSHPALKGLKGIRAHCTSTLWCDGKPVHSEYGELQFTDYGLSGIPALQHSCRLQGKKQEISIDFFPDLQPAELTAMITQRAQLYPGETLENALLGLINKKLLSALLKSAEITPTSRTISSLCKQEIRKLAETLKNWRFPITGTLDWEQAQVTRGGIPLSDVDAQFASVKEKGLYFAGEILDVQGDCGGYNLHWAWCSGMTAGNAAAEYLK